MAGPRVGPRPIDIPLDPRADSEHVRIALNRVMQDVHINTFEGLATHRTTQAAVDVDSMDNGQFIMVKDGATWYLYTKIEDVLYKAELTAV